MLAGILFIEEDLAVEISRIDQVAVGNAQAPDAAAGKLIGNGAAERAAADEQDMGVGQSLLAGRPDLRQQNLPVVAILPGVGAEHYNSGCDPL